VLEGDWIIAWLTRGLGIAAVFASLGWLFMLWKEEQ
jgi:hypothetical protein